MIGSLGFSEILLILVLALLIFGPKRLPEVGRTIGKGLAEFRRASNDLKRTVNAELALDENEHSALTRRVPLPAALLGTDAAPAPPASAPPPAGTAPRTSAPAADESESATATPLGPN